MAVSISTTSVTTATTAARGQYAPSGLTVYGVMLFGICSLLAASGSTDLRESMTRAIFGRSTALIHPYLIPLAFIFPALAVTRIRLLPISLLALFSLFASLYYISTIYGGVDEIESIKITTTLLTIAATALLVRTWDDFAAGAVGMCMAIGLLAFVGLEDGAQTQKFIQSTSRNAYSLYSLPAILLGGYLLTRQERTSIGVRVVIAVCIAGAAIAQMLTRNRSGWLGMGVIALLLLPSGRMRTIVLTLTLALGTYYFLETSGGIDPVRERMNDLKAATESDHLRIDLLKASARIAVEAPLIGISPQNLERELGHRLGYDKVTIESHNVLAQLAAGSGIPCMLTLLGIGVLLWRWKPEPNWPNTEKRRFLESRKLLRMMLVLWLFRGMFTSQILYSPAFSMGLGMCIGLCARFNPVGYAGLAPMTPTTSKASGRRRSRYRRSHSD